MKFVIVTRSGLYRSKVDGKICWSRSRENAIRYPNNVYAWKLVKHLENKISGVDLFVGV